MNTKDWIDGYKSGYGQALKEIFYVSTPYLEKIEKSLENTEKSLDKIKDRKIKIIDRIKNFFI